MLTTLKECIYAQTVAVHYLQGLVFIYILEIRQGNSNQFLDLNYNHETAYNITLERETT